MLTSKISSIDFTRIKVIDLEVLLILLISFSPLLSQIMKLLMVICYVLFNYKYLKRPSKKTGIPLLSIILLITIGGLKDFHTAVDISDITFLGVYFIFCFLSGFIIITKYSTHLFLKSVDRVVFISAIFSLISVILYTYFPGVIRLLPSYNYYHTNHKTAYVFNILVGEMGLVMRNAGFAWEPGAYQLILSLGLFSYIKTSPSLNILKTAIYLITIITTESTAGLIVFLFIVFRLIKENRIYLGIVIIASIFSFPKIWSVVTYQVKYKLFYSYAFQLRFQPMTNAFNQSKLYILGNGNIGFNNIYRQGNTPPWDSYMQILSRYGYPLLIILFIILWRMFKYDKVLFVIFAVSLSSQNVWYFPLLTAFYFLVFKDAQKTIA